MSLLRTLVHHPRKLWLRRTLFQVHLWVGVLLSLYIVMIALTGSILVFRTELTRALLPKTLAPYAADSVSPIAIVLEHFRTAYPEARLENIQMPSPQMPAFLLSATDRHQHPFTLLAHPVTADLRLQPRTWLYWTYELHANLLLGEAHGVQVNGDRCPMPTPAHHHWSRSLVARSQNMDSRIAHWVQAQLEAYQLRRPQRDRLLDLVHRILVGFVRNLLRMVPAGRLRRCCGCPRSRECYRPPSQRNRSPAQIALRSSRY